MPGKLAEYSVATFTDGYLQRATILRVNRYGKVVALDPAAHEKNIYRNCDILCCYLLDKPLPRKATEELAIGLLVEIAMRDWLHECLKPHGLRVLLATHTLDSVPGEAGSDLMVCRNDDNAVVLLVDVSSKKKFYDRNAWSSWLGVPIMHWFVGTLKLPIKIKKQVCDVDLKTFVREHWKPAVLFGRIAAPEYYPTRDEMLKEQAQANVTESLHRAIARLDHHVLESGTIANQKTWQQHRAILVPDPAQPDFTEQKFSFDCFQVAQR